MHLPIRFGRTIRVELMHLMVSERRDSGHPLQFVADRCDPVLFLAARHDPQYVVGQRTLQFGPAAHQQKAKDRPPPASQNDRHSLRMNRSDDGVRFRGQEAEKLLLALNRPLFGPRTPRQRVHRPAKANSGRSSLSANHMGVLRGLASAYSQNDVAGTTQRLACSSHRRQCGLPTLRMFVIAAARRSLGAGARI